MSQYLHKCIVLLLCVLMTQQADSQCNGQEVPVAALTCADAPVLCQIDCLDGFSSTLPNFYTGGQPASLCFGGEANNMSWFAFVAGSDSINLLITPSSCSTETVDGANYRGIQVGIWTGCDFDGDSEPFICEADASESPIEISGGDFNIGDTYYLFVDGNVGSVCDYSVDVQFGEQAFEMPEIDSLTNNLNFDFENDTICVGASVEITSAGLDIEAEYVWMIDPATDEYPVGIHPVNDTSTVAWLFTQEGSYELSVFARNGCDANDTFRLNIIVDTLIDEYFTDIEVCENCLGSLVLGNSDTTCVIGELGLLAPSILTEDPNNDGIKGWQGFDNVISWGQQENIVNAQYGCSYSQFVNIEPIPIGPREDVKIYICEGDFPYDYYGNIISGPTENQLVTLDNAAVSRCDSLVSLTVESYGQNAVIENRDCIGGGLEIAVDINGFIPVGSILSYEWIFDSMILTDNDGIDSTIIAMQSGFYTVKGTLDLGGGIICTFTRSKLIDLNNITPDTPNFGVLPSEVCDDDQAIVFVDQVGSSMTYSWSLVPPLPFSEGVTSDTIYVDVSGNNGFQYSVSATNDCGTSLDTMQIMQVSTLPTVDIDMLSSVCQDSILTISYTGDADLAVASFDWGFDGGEIVQTAGLNGPGPHEVRFASGPNKTLSLSVTQGACTTEIYTEEVQVIEPISLPAVDCEQLFEGVTFTIIDLPIGVTYSYEVVSGSFATETDIDGVITFGGMDINSAIEINVNFETECGILDNQYSCSSLDCPQLDLDISIDAPDGFCYDADEMNVSVSARLDGMLSESGTWTGMHLSSNGNFDAITAGVGLNTITYSITNSDGCTYQDSALIEIFPSPNLSFDIIDEDCDPAAGVAVNVTSDISAISYLDEMASPDSMFFNVGPGDHIIRVSTINNCIDTETINIAPQTVTSIELEGSVSVEEKLESIYTFDSNITPDSILWLINGEVNCESCTELVYVPEDEDELCVVIFDEQGCEHLSCVYIDTYKKTKVFFPTIFSPNGDNNNDSFFPISNNPTLPVVKMMIFDRWGNCVFHQENKTMGEEGTSWDGRFNGQVMDNGVYVYRLQYLDESGTLISVNGDVVLYY